MAKYTIIALILIDFVPIFPVDPTLCSDNIQTLAISFKHYYGFLLRHPTEKVIQHEMGNLSKRGWQFVDTKYKPIGEQWACQLPVYNYYTLFYCQSSLGLSMNDSFRKMYDRF